MRLLLKTIVTCGLLVFVFVSAVGAQSAEPGRQVFASRCAACHGTEGGGGELGPSIVTRIPLRSDAELEAVVREGLPGSGMPAFANVSAAERADLIAFLRTLRPRTSTGPARVNVTMADGKSIAGVVLNQSDGELQLLGDDRALHLLRETTAGSAPAPAELQRGSRYRQVTSQTGWATYHGQPSGNRYSALTQITAANVGRLAPRWVFTLPNAAQLQVTPLVVDGVMYITAANDLYALDAGSGRQIWNYRRTRTRGLAGVAARGVNRGVAVGGDRVFMTTDHAHLIALNRASGALLWETEMADWHQNYNGTGAPLVVDNLVISGIAGGDEGVRGFVAAYDQATGKEVWRFWAVPARGEPGSETWKGSAIDHPGAATWMTGSYDTELGTLYWAIGNPGPDMIGDERAGDNLYSDSVVALDVKTGRRKWHFQFTPHDVHDYDAQQPMVLVDAPWKGTPRKLLLQANRNGYFYVLDRVTGEYLSGTQYVKNITWASGLTKEGRPIVVPNMEPTREGKRVCPSLEGASNWYSAAFSPRSGLFYVQTNDKCGIFTRVDQTWESGKGFMGGTFAAAPEPARRVLRAIDIQTGKVTWELPQFGAVDSWGGVLATAGDVVFFGDDSGAFAAADARSGKRLWSFQTSQVWKSSPMTYVFDNRQLVAVASGPSILAFGLPQGSGRGQAGARPGPGLGSGRGQVGDRSGTGQGQSPKGVR
ncbi:MAG TPA: PQQ-dependent dehydrogenase, methanol/ethanol family [Vicinamibacterales bacterium]